MRAEGPLVVSPYFINTARLTPYAKRPRAATGYVTVYSFEPRPDEPAAQFGNLYAVIEVISGGREAEEVAGLTIETAGTAYYESDGPESVVDRFEAATKAINRALTEYVNRGNASWVGKMSAIVAVLHDNEIHIAYTGSAEAYLYRAAQPAQITQHPHNRIQQPSKIFASIASGQLEVGDKLLLGTPALVHQLSLKELEGIVIEHQPTAAIAKMASKLSGQPADRVAALIIELTTPELAAQMMPGNDSSHVDLRSHGGTILEQAKATAAPLVETATKHSRDIGQRVQSTGQRLWPRLQKGGWNLAGRLRQFLQGSRRRRLTLIIVVGAIVIVGGLGLILNSNRGASTQLKKSFTTIAQTVSGDSSAVSAGSTGPRSQLVSQQSKLQSLAIGGHRAELDRWLALQPESANLPQSVASLQKTIQTDIDTIDHLQRISPVIVARLTSIKPTGVAIVGNEAVLTAAKGQIYQVNLQTGALKSSKADTSQIGSIIATTPSAAGNGVYLLTDQPSIWLYLPASDQLSHVNPAVSTPWPKATAIASYGSNLYLLTSDGVDKYTPTISGFSQPILSLPASSQGVSTAKLLAIDGTLTLTSPRGITRYLSGSLVGQGTVPSGFTGISQLLPGNGNYIVAADSASGRVAIIDTTGQTLAASRQYLPTEGHFSAVALDPTTSTIYALSNNELVKFAVSGL